jgi:peptidoglycan hydrolase CwlO-like protein
MNSKITCLIGLSILGAVLAFLATSSPAQAPEQGKQEERIDRLEKRLAEIDMKLAKIDKSLTSIDTGTKRNGDIIQKGFDELIKRSPPPKP